jgi:hypothetical protein
VRPNLDGANFGFAHRIGQAAKADAIRKAYAQKAAVSQPTSGNSVPLGVTKQVKVRQHVHGEIAAKRSVAMAAIATNSGDLDRALIELDVVGLMSVGCGIEAGDRNVDRSVDRYVEVDEAPREMPVTAGAGAVAAGRNDVGADQTQEGGGETGISANRSIAVPAITAITRKLAGTLMEFNRVRLMGISGAMKARHCDVDRIEHRHRSMHQRSGEVAIATIPGTVVSGRDHVGAERSEPADASADCGIRIAAIPANPGYLGRRLIENPDVGLMSAGCRVGARLRHIERLECGVAAVDQTPGKIAVPAIAGIVASRVDREVGQGTRRKPRRN